MHGIPTLLERIQTPQIWSQENPVNYRPDVFELEDGRIIRVAYAGESCGRAGYSVKVLTAGWHGTKPEQAVLGYCGNLWKTEAGSWELYPAERAAQSYNRTGRYEGIHKDTGATLRDAAVELLAWSDHYTKSIHDRAEGGDSLVCGNWRVALLPEDASQPRLCAFSKPAKHSVRVRGFRVFLVNRRDGGEAFRVVVQVGRNGCGYALRASVHGVARSVDGRRPADITGRPSVPLYVQKFCLDRCVLG